MQIKVKNCSHCFLAVYFYDSCNKESCLCTHPGAYNLNVVEYWATGRTHPLCELFKEPLTVSKEESEL